MALLKFLSPSRPFVVYSQYKEVRSSRLGVFTGATKTSLMSPPEEG